jgi:hypothetical protein
MYELKNIWQDLRTGSALSKQYGWATSDIKKKMLL